MYNNLTIKELLYIQNLATTQKISDSAKNFDIAQANFSKIINSAEEKIGVRIFNRDIRPLLLTDFGKGFITHTDKIIASHRELKNYISEYVNTPNGNVRIYCQLVFRFIFHAMLYQLQIENYQTQQYQ